MLNETQQETLTARLDRIESQVRGIRKMVQEPRLCHEILQQLATTEAALSRVSLAISRFHVASCVPSGITKGDGESRKRLGELVDIFDRFSK
jgi:DNA-binding FrmR family transcriptional regulator